MTEWHDRVMHITKHEVAELRKILHKMPNGPCFVRSLEIQAQAKEVRGCKDGKSYLQGNLRFDLVSVGAIMEDEGVLLQTANNEFGRSKQLLRDTTQDIARMADITIPILTDQVNHIRALRMTITQETNKTMTALREVSDFFIEHKYEEEMQRLQRFIGLCEQLKALKQDGTLDALSDTIIRLAYKETTK